VPIYTEVRTRSSSEQSSRIIQQERKSEKRGLEGMLEEELVRLRICNSSEVLTYSRLLARQGRWVAGACIES
jgi:hypothetical protein